jgi:glutathione synthase/RimK-type ligase-like ATP-grasp enzyme
VNGRECWGIFRERAHSPGREFDDGEILRLTGKHLDAMGFHVSLMAPNDLPASVSGPPPVVFMMCEQTGILEQLRQWEQRGACIVNSPLSILNTYRERMVWLLDQAHIAAPVSRIVPTSTSSLTYTSPVWVKRGDVHSTQDGDVTFASDEHEAKRALRLLAARDVQSAVIQDHIPGDLIKFYGIGRQGLVPRDDPWFRWFYHKDQHIAGHPFDPEKLADLARRAASALGLEIYGGDMIVSEGGTATVIDLNAWPSFALYREEAAERIASYLTERFSEGHAS